MSTVFPSSDLLPICCHYKACRTRAENKDICELPAKVEKTSVQAQR
jgi:hypothetical protein